MKRLLILTVLFAAVSLLPSCDVQNDADVIPPEIVGIDYSFIELTQVADYVWQNGDVSPIGVRITVTLDTSHRVDVYYDGEWIAAFIGVCRNQIAAFSFMKEGGVFSIVVDNEYEEGIRLQ